MTSALEWKEGVGYQLKSFTQTYFITQDDIINPIGTGTFGQVIKATDSQNHQLAIKKIQKNCGLPIQKIQNEIQAMTKITQINASNVLCALDSIEDSTTFYIVMPCYDKANFTSFITSNSIKSEWQAIEYLRQICYGLMVLHSIGIIHRDLKTDNILVRKCNDPNYPLEYELAIADMGIATEKEKLEKTKEVGTYYTMAPEVSTGLYDAKVDVYSVGCIFYKMLTMKEPFATRKKNSAVLPVATYFEMPLEEMSLKILTQCLQYNKEDRCDLEYLLNLLDVKAIYSSYRPIKFSKDQMIALFPVKNAKISRQFAQIPISNCLPISYLKCSINALVIRQINRNNSLPMLCYQAKEKPLPEYISLCYDIISFAKLSMISLYQWVVATTFNAAVRTKSIIELVWNYIIELICIALSTIESVAMSIYSTIYSCFDW